MELNELLAYAVKYRATGLSLRVDAPMEVHVGKETRRINLPPLTAADFEELVMKRLGAPARESLRTTGHCDETVDIAGLGNFRMLVEAGKARIVLPDSMRPRKEETPPSAAPGAVPTFGDRLRGLFGRK
jgi:Tfp pilus assembly pilus retraction ATPase PilT